MLGGGAHEEDEEAGAMVSTLENVRFSRGGPRSPGPGRLGRDSAGGGGGPPHAQLHSAGAQGVGAGPAWRGWLEGAHRSGGAAMAAPPSAMPPPMILLRERMGSSGLGGYAGLAFGSAIEAESLGRTGPVGGLPSAAASDACLRPGSREACVAVPAEHSSDFNALHSVPLTASSLAVIHEGRPLGGSGGDGNGNGSSSGPNGGSHSSVEPNTSTVASLNG
jgi:hypothetical protein